MFIDNLENMDISPDDYLKKARKIAKSHGYYGDLEFSTRKNKKLMYDHNGKYIHFGGADNMDFILHKMTKNPNANERRELYHKRASKLAEQSDKYSPSKLSLLILW